MKNVFKFVTHNACSHVIAKRHWEYPLVDRAAHRETRGFSAFSPSIYVKAKLAILHCLDRVNSVLDIRKPHRNAYNFQQGAFSFLFSLKLSLSTFVFSFSFSNNQCIEYRYTINSLSQGNLLSME